MGPGVGFLFSARRDLKGRAGSERVQYPPTACLSVCLSVPPPIVAGPQPGPLRLLPPFLAQPARRLADRHRVARVLGWS